MRVLIIIFYLEYYADLLGGSAGNNGQRFLIWVIFRFAASAVRAAALPMALVNANMRQPYMVAIQASTLRSKRWSMGANSGGIRPRLPSFNKRPVVSRRVK